MRPEGKKNIRRNTSAILRIKKRLHDGRIDDQATKTILIDCGKSFLTSALEWFPKKGFRKIDALIITHAHSDAMSGLDDLRGWTLGGAIQPSMDIYVTQVTFNEIQRTYPYLVIKELATGGGDVPAMNWIIFNEAKTFNVCGVTVTPLPVHHGVYFVKKEPYWCLGFMFNRSIAYISDVSHIPESTWALLEGSELETNEAESDTAATKRPPWEVNAHANASQTNGLLELHAPISSTLRQRSPPTVLIIDCLRVYPHTSHFGIAQAVATARRLKSRRTYTLGFAHRVTHATWERTFAAVTAGERPKKPPKIIPGGLQANAANMSYGAFNPNMRHSDNGEELQQIALETIEEWEGKQMEAVWIKAAYDGQAIYIDEATGSCRDQDDGSK